jgi:ectoine hydrolase
MLPKELYFSLEEYARRLKQVKASMDREGIELLLVVDPANMNYLTGYDGWSFYVHQGLIVSLDREEPLWFGRAQDSNGARITTWLSEESIIGYPDHYVQSRYTHTMRFVADTIRDFHWERRRTGVEMDGYWFSARMYNELVQQLPEAEFRDATSLVAWVKSVKSEAEIGFIRQAGLITRKAMELATEMIDVGVPEKDVAAAVSGAQIAGIDPGEDEQGKGFGGDSSAIFPIIPSAERTSSAHLTFHPDRSYKKGDVVLLELGAARHRYHAPLSRTVYLGSVPDDLKKVSQVVVSGLQRTLEFIRPGVTAEEVEQFWRGCLKGTGVEKPSRVGYSFGLAYVPDWGEHTISLRPGDKTVLQPGMTIHFMPGIWLDTYGFECSEPFLVTGESCEKLIEFPEKLFTK